MFNVYCLHNSLERNYDLTINRRGQGGGAGGIGNKPFNITLFKVAYWIRFFSADSVFDYFNIAIAILNFSQTSHIVIALPTS